MAVNKRNLLPRNSKQIERICVDKRTEFFDGRTSGLVLRVGAGKTGRKVWAYSYRRPGTGRRTKITIGPFPNLSLKDAEERACQYRAMLLGGLDPQMQEATDPALDTVRDLATLYLEQHSKINKRSWRSDERILEKDVLPVIGDLRADSLTRRDVKAVLDPIDQRGAKVKVDLVFALVRGIFRWGVSRGYLSNDPTREMKRRHKPSSRARHLSASEIVRLWTRLDETGLSQSVRLALRLSIVTGQRIGEVCGAELSEFNLLLGVWEIPKERAKNGRAHKVPLSALARGLIAEAQQTCAGERYLFASRSRSRVGSAGAEEQALRPHSLTTAVRRKLEVIGSADKPFTPHDFRRTVATILQAEGVKEEVVASLLNHTSEHAKTTTRSVYMQYDFWDERVAAMDLVAMQNPASNVFEMRQASTLRVCQSMIATRYRKPRRIGR